MNQNSLEESQRRRQEADYERRLANLEPYLGCGDPEREEAYWRFFRETKARLDLLRRTSVAPKATALDLEKVAHFLENLDHEWERYPSRLRNRLLKLLIDRVEVKHKATDIEVMLCWKVGLRQVVKIRRAASHLSRGKPWGGEEEGLLKLVWPSSSREAIMAALPGRSWAAIGEKASVLKICR
ncbi:MAG: hypothetical protein HY670_04925 [Chloroflexi bacterium]|nr:hypothetical protein [Chloroflexota bacterium]